MMDMEKQFNEAFEKFNWRAVSALMMAANWRWSNDELPPTIDKMKENVKSLYKSCKGGGKWSSGGFTVTVDDYSVSIEFTISSTVWA